MNTKGNLEDYMEEYGKNQLSLFRKKVKQNFEKLLKKRRSLENENKGFQIQLITIAGGTITLFLALQTGQDVNFLIKLGFALLGLSLLFGVTSLFLGIEAKQFEIFMDEEADLLSQKIGLDFIERFGHQDVAFDKEMMDEKKKLMKEYKKKFDTRQERINQILKWLFLDGQKIEDGQVLLFLLGVASLLIGIFI